MAKRTRGKEIKGKKTKDKPKCSIYIFCEGETERIYLEHFSNRIYNVEIIPVDPKHTDAVGIVNFARKYIKNHELRKDLGDRGYCVFDSDPGSNLNIEKAFQMLRESRSLKPLFSNPSFEVWFALHYGRAPHGFTAGKMKAHVKILVKDKFPNYCETTDLYDYLLDRQEDATRRARELYEVQKENHGTVYSHESNPYTDMFWFIEYMTEIKNRNI